MNEREEIEVGRVVKPKKQPTGRDAVLDALAQLEPHHRRFELQLKAIVDQVWATTHRYTKATIRTYVTSIMCANAPIHHAIHYNDLERVGPGLYRRCTAPWSPRPLPNRQALLAAQQLHGELAHLCERWERELHIRPTWLPMILRRCGGLETIRRYLFTKATESELNQLWDRGCLDESLEALILQPPYTPLITPAEQRAAQRRLNARGINTQRRRVQLNPTQRHMTTPWSTIQAHHRE